METKLASPNPATQSSTPRIAPRTGFLLGLDLSMLGLVSVLWCLQLTGLTLHEWLGFVLCPLVLLHVVLQWQWFVTQFRRFMMPGAYRARINYLLNVLLLIMMAAVLFSGILISTQLAPLFGEHFGRQRVWRELHGWVNGVVIVLVGLHLALNWDWIIARLRRRRPEPAGSVIVPARPSSPTWAMFQYSNFATRSICILGVASVSAFAAYAAMNAMLEPEKPAIHMRTESNVNRPAAEAPRKQASRRRRPIFLPGGVIQFVRTVAVLVFVFVIARYVLRIHL